MFLFTIDGGVSKISVFQNTTGFKSERERRRHHHGKRRRRKRRDVHGAERPTAAAAANDDDDDAERPRDFDEYDDIEKTMVAANAFDASMWSHNNATLKRSGGDDPLGEKETTEDFEANENSHWWTLEARSVALSREAKVQWNREVDLPCEDARERRMKAQTGEFNVWYGRSATQPGELSYHERKPAPTRCVAAFDCGATKADAR